MDIAQGLGKGWNGRNIWVRFIVPFGQGGQFGERHCNRLAERFLKKPFGRMIDRLNRQHPGDALLVEHMVRMHDLAMALPKLEFAGNPTRRANWQTRFDPMMIGEKKDEENVPSLILDQNLVRRLRARARRIVDG